MNFDLHEVSTHVSDSTMEILRIQLQNAGEPQSQKKEEGGDAHVPHLGRLPGVSFSGGRGGL